MLGKGNQVSSAKASKKPPNRAVFFYLGEKVARWQMLRWQVKSKQTAGSNFGGGYSTAMSTCQAAMHGRAHSPTLSIPRQKTGKLCFLPFLFLEK